MPHQLAVRSGVIHPKYPQAPRQWVSYLGDQPGPGGGGMPPPNLGTGIQRDFSRRWGGDAESQFPRIDALARAGVLGAIGKVLSSSLRDGDDEQGAGFGEDDPQPPPLGDPGDRTKVRALTGPKKQPPQAGQATFDDPGGTLNYDNVIDVESRETTGSTPQGGPPNELPQASRSTQETTPLPDMSFLEPAVEFARTRAGGGDGPQRTGGPTTGPSFVSPALTRQQESPTPAPTSRRAGRPSGGISPRSRREIQQSVASFDTLGDSALAHVVRAANSVRPEDMDTYRRFAR